MKITDNCMGWVILFRLKEPFKRSVIETIEIFCCFNKKNCNLVFFLRIILDETKIFDCHWGLVNSDMAAFGRIHEEEFAVG